MAEHDEHSSFIKTPQQLITVVALSFVVPIFGIIMLVQLVLNKPSADPGAMTPDAVAARIQPVGRVEFGAAGPAAGAAPRTGEELVKAVCAACHIAGVANAPKLGDKAGWAPAIKRGLPEMLKSVIAGKGAMPPRAGAADATDAELTSAIIFMANQAGGNLKDLAAALANPAAKGK
ncbi:MAG: c-type cytochrome [Proteobacteria bacterium]|nr:c-type cytochrome [Pseudomonadota bacterium]